MLPILETPSVSEAQEFSGIVDKAEAAKPRCKYHGLCDCETCNKLRESMAPRPVAQCEALDVEGLQCYREAESVVYVDNHPRPACYCHRVSHEDGNTVIFINFRSDTIPPPAMQHDGTKEWLERWVRDDDHNYSGR